MTDKYTLLFYHPTMEKLAQMVAEHPDYKGRVRLGKCSWAAFNDGFPNIRVDGDDSLSMEYHDVAFLANLSKPADIFEQLAIMYALPRMRACNFRVFVPYFSTGTMERVDTFGEVATASTMARILSAIPLCKSGPSTVVVYDIHALQEQFYFADSVLVQLRSAVYLLRQKLRCLPDVADVSIAFPDDGAAKRFKARVKEFEHIICIKVREGDTRRVTVKEGNAAGRHCVILDDLVQTGGTLIECAKALLGAGAAKVSCFVTHGVFPQESWKRFLGTDAAPTPFHKVWITDTIPDTAAAVTGQGPFEVLSIAPLVGNLLTGDAPLEDL